MMNRTMTMGVILLAGLSMADVEPSPATEPSPYAGLERREIKALSADEVAGYLAGKGMGFAMAAELNDHPGPKHVLELAEGLGLSEAATRRTREIFSRMQEEASRLGVTMVEKERLLDDLFASGKATEETVRALVSDIARIRGAIRFAHLRAHLAMRRILTDDQVAMYRTLRGYAAGEHAGHHGHHVEER